MIAGRFLRTDENSDVLLPKRQTAGSAGYDFYAPYSMNIPAHSYGTFKTGVIADISEGYVLLLFPRSSLGMRGIRIANTVGVIDSDYKLEIHCKLVNDSNEDILIEKDSRYMQGVFVKFGIIEDDEVVNIERTGGMGSTGN